MTFERVKPPLVAQEKRLLHAWRDAHRDTPAVTCGGRIAAAASA